MASQLSWPQEMTNYEKTVFDREITYLSPEEIKELHFGHTDPKCNFELAESFSIGLTLLDSAVLTDSQDIYTPAESGSNYRFSYEKLHERIQHLHELSHLDDVLKQIIVGLCTAEPSQRLNCSEVFKWLEKYKEKILNIEPF